jgi:hypothetical protein
MSLLASGEIGIYTLPRSVEFSDNPLRHDSGKYHITRNLARAAVTQKTYGFFIENYTMILEALGIDRTTDDGGKTQTMINQAENYFYNTNNTNICSPLSVGYLARNLQDSENFAIYIGMNGREPGKVINNSGKKILQKATLQFIPKNMISFRFVGSHIHVIAFCTNNKNKGGGGRLVTILKETCKGGNIPCISLYALSSAESYYLLQGFVFLTDNDGNVVTQGRLKAMVWYNPAFKLDDYFESDGLHRLSEINVPSSDYKLNRAINDKLTLENIVEIWVELANHSIVSQESRQNQEIVDAIEASPEILNNPEVLNYIQDTQPEQYKIMTPQISEIKKRARSSSRTSSDDEEPIIYGKPDTNRPSRRRFIVESDDEEDQKGGSRKRKRTKKTKKAKRKYKKNKRTYKR